MMVPTPQCPCCGCPRGRIVEQIVIARAIVNVIDLQANANGPTKGFTLVGNGGRRGTSRIDIGPIDNVC